MIDKPAAPGLYVDAVQERAGYLRIALEPLALAAVCMEADLFEPLLGRYPVLRFGS